MRERYAQAARAAQDDSCTCCDTPTGGGFGATRYDPSHLGQLPADAVTASVQKMKLRTGGRNSLFEGTQPIPGGGVASDGAIRATLSIGDPSVQRPTLLIGVNQAGKSWKLADLLADELGNNPDGQDLAAPDSQSNPYSVLALPGRPIVADAAGNPLIELRPHRRARVLLSLIPI